MSHDKPSVIVLGAGAAGLAAAWELMEQGSTQVTVLERMPMVGGLISFVEKNGNKYEYGTHVFHTNNESLRERVKALMGDRLIEFERLSKLHIKFRDNYFRYPLNGMDILFNLPLRLSLHCVLSFLYSNLIWTLKGKEPANAAEVLQKRFGYKLYDIFFKDYTHKFWGMPCEQLDPVFAMERIPRSDVIKVLHDLFEKLGLQRFNLGHPLTERAIGKLYYSKNGIHDLADTMARHVQQKGGRILTGVTLQSIRLADNQVMVEYNNSGALQTVLADYLISTIPIRALIPLFSPVPEPPVLAAASRLTFLPLTVCGLLISRKPIRDAYCTYFREQVFNRLSEPTNHGLQTVPKGRSILLAEMTDFTLQERGLHTDNAIIAEVISDLIKENLIRREEVEDTCIFRYPEAYPIYHIGFQSDLQLIDRYLNSLGRVFSTGRQGKFYYVNTHVTMQMAIKTVREI